MYLGKEEVLTVSTPDNEDNVNITFKDRKEGLTIHKDLYELSKNEFSCQGDAETAMYFCIARKILNELADLGITVIELPTIGSYLGNLVDNLQNEVIGEKFGVTNPKMMKLSQIIKK